MHVGDSLESDVVGANNAGATSVWLNPTGSANAPARQNGKSGRNCAKRRTGKHALAPDLSRTSRKDAEAENGDGQKAANRPGDRHAKS